MRRSLLSILALLSLGITAAHAQTEPGTDLREIYSFGDDYFLEVTALPGASGNKSRVLVLFRLTYDLMTFRKEPAVSTPGDVYVATPTLTVEAQGLDGVIADQAIWTDTVRTDLYRSTNSKQLLAPGWVELELRPGTYTISYSVGSGGPNRQFTRDTEPFSVPDFHSGSPAIGIPIFLREISGDTLTASAVDGNTLFGRKLSAWVPLASRSEPENLRFDLFKAGDQEGGLGDFVATGTARTLPRTSVSPPVALGSDIGFLLRRDSLPDEAHGALIEHDAAALEPGGYELVLTYEAGVATALDTIPFELRWIDMPFTLSSTSYAIKALYPIASDDEIDELLSGDSLERVAHLTEYWAKQDPTPGTTWNERMAEYYRRVDYALVNFATLTEEDGAFTDRGKIYILFGPPTNVRREFDPEDKPREIWTYRNVVGREFVFVDRRESGAYSLVDYYDL